MLIDWFTVIAQGVNFLILVWLMKRFLYTPILNAIDSREKRIAAELAEAGATKEQAHREHKEFRSKNEEFDRQRTSLLHAAGLEAKAERHRLLTEVRWEAEELRSRQQEALRLDFLSLKEELVRRTRDEVFAIARKTLADLATADLEHCMAEAFLRRCRALGGEEGATLRAAFAAAPGPAVVRSVFALPADIRAAIERGVGEMLAYRGPFRFETSPDLLGGIELSLNGHEVAWTIADYLGVLEKNVAEPLRGQAFLAERGQEGSDQGEAGPAPETGEGVDENGQRP